MKQIIIDPRLKYNYASWYLLGVKRLLKGWKIIYDVRPFKGLKYENTADYNSDLPLLSETETDKKRSLLIPKMLPRFLKTDMSGVTSMEW